MANTVIQIKRSSSTTTPVNGSLSAAELAYSYASDRLFIGTANGLNVNEIGGTYWINNTIAAFDKANDISSSANSYATSIGEAANAWSNTVGAAGNSYAQQVGTAGNTWASTTFYAKTGGTISGDVVVTGNLTISGCTTYANTQTLNIGDSLFTLNADLPVSASPSENAGMEVNRGNSPTVSVIWNESYDKWTLTNDGTNWYNIATNNDITSVTGDITAAFNHANAAYGMANTTYSNYAYPAYINAGAAFDKANTANINASNASYLSIGTVPSARVSGSYTGITGVGTLTSGTWNADIITVPYGGTGKSSFTTNGILYGNNSGDLKVTAAGTEGQVLQSNASGVPSFGMLDGGTF